jgi:hypothetical protein
MVAVFFSAIFVPVPPCLCLSCYRSRGCIVGIVFASQGLGPNSPLSRMAGFGEERTNDLRPHGFWRREVTHSAPRVAHVFRAMSEGAGAGLSQICRSWCGH